ncbi:MAG: hypothetical protein RLZZ95_622, partial [Pseudomonadota bacterium]
MALRDFYWTCCTAKKLAQRLQRGMWVGDPAHIFF